MFIGTRPLLDSTMTLLERVLDFRAQRHILIASNIANAETPHAQATDIAFESVLKDVSSSKHPPVATHKHPRHLPISVSDHAAISPSFIQRRGLGVGNDLNSIDLDTEMTQLAQNSLLYSATTQLLSKKFGGLRLAIDGGR